MQRNNTPKGYTLVPDSALRWLFGEEGRFKPPPELVERHERIYGRLGAYWWRSVFRDKIAAGAPDKDEQQAALFRQHSQETDHGTE